MMAVRKFKSMTMNHSLILFLFLSMIEVCIASLNVNGARNGKKELSCLKLLNRKNRCYFYPRGSQ